MYIMVKKNDYGIEITPATHAKLFRAVIVGAVTTLVLFGFYMTGEYLVDMHRENRRLHLWSNRDTITIAEQHERITGLESQNEALLDERDHYASRLNLFHLDGEINKIIYEPGDPDAAQPLEWEAK